MSTFESGFLSSAKKPQETHPTPKEPFLPKTLETPLTPDVALEMASPTDRRSHYPPKKDYAAQQILGIALAGTAVYGAAHVEPQPANPTKSTIASPETLKDQIISERPGAAHESARTQHWSKDHEPFASRSELPYETATRPEDGVSKEAREIIHATTWHAAGHFLKRTDLPTKIETPEQQDLLESQIDEVINQAILSSETTLERIGQKNTHLVASDRIAIQVFAEAIREFAQAHPDVSVPFGNCTLALNHRLRSQKDHILYTGFSDEALFHHTNLVYADIDGRLRVLRFKVIRDTHQRLNFLGERPEGLIPNNNLAALQSDLPWMMDHRTDIARHRDAWTNTTLALSMAIDSGQARGRQLQDLRFLQSYLRLHQPQTR